MKKMIVFLTLIAIGFSSFAQTETDNVKTKKYYLDKSRKQRTTGWIMLGGGVALTGIGIGAAVAESINYVLGDSKSGNIGSVLATVGVVSALGSIPVFICASKNKRKAAEVAFSIQKLPSMLYSSNGQAAFQPALTLKVSIK
ncbi:MAG: hypothetical protein ABIP31_01015 [Chitinophagaceae bacterium]